MNHKDCKMKLSGVVTVGPKGQVVIPKEAREVADIKPGDSLVVITKDDKYIGLVKNEDLDELMKYVTIEKNK